MNARLCGINATAAVTGSGIAVIAVFAFFKYAVAATVPSVTSGWVATIIVSRNTGTVSAKEISNGRASTERQMLLGN